MQKIEIAPHNEPMICPICNSISEKKFHQHPGYQEPTQYDIYHCFSCDTAFSNPLEVEEQVYNHIYSQIEKVPGYSRYYKYSNQVLIEQNPLEFLARSEDVYWAIKQSLDSLSHQNELQILEVGCGFGYLTYALHQAGYNVEGIDISSIAIKNACEKYGDLFTCIDVKALAEKNSSPKYDVIIFTEVIEHIKDVKGFLKATSQLLKPNGKLLLTTPNKSAYNQDVLWETECPPIHLFWFSEKSIEFLASKIDCIVSFIDFTEFSLDEIRRMNHLTKPINETRHFQPTHSPTLDTRGNIITLNNHSEKVSIKNAGLSPFRIGCKKILHTLGLLAPLAFIKRKIKEAHSSYQEQKRLDALKKLVLKGTHRRPTLCAELTKKDPSENTKPQ